MSEHPFAGTTFETRSERGAREERAAIVAYLRKRGDPGLNPFAHSYADAIERGDHLTPEEDEK